MEIQVQGYDYQYFVTWQIFWIRELHLQQSCWESSSTHPPIPQVASSEGKDASSYHSHQNILYSRLVCSVGLGLCLRKAFKIFWPTYELYAHLQKLMWACKELRSVAQKMTHNRKRIHIFWVSLYFTKI